MKVFALKCPQCGGSQNVADDRDHVECRYCRTLLRVERSPSGELEQLLIEARAENVELVVENRRLVLTNAIHRLDAAWTAHRPELLVPAKIGTREPSELLAYGSILVGIVVAGLGVKFLFTLGVGVIATHEGEGIAGIAFIVMGLMVVGFGIGERKAAARYHDAKTRYERRRKELSDELASAEAVFRDRSRYEDTTMRRKRLDNVAYPAADA